MKDTQRQPDTRLRKEGGRFEGEQKPSKHSKGKKGASAQHGHRQEAPRSRGALHKEDLGKGTSNDSFKDSTRGHGQHRAMPSSVAHKGKESAVEVTPSHTQVKAQAVPLFGADSAFCRDAFAALPKVLDSVMPLQRSHRADLPEAVRDLSEILTSERNELGRSYWSSPRFVSAYVRYFLPWNLVRLTRLLPSLSLPAPTPEARLPIVMDLGCGPLTLPLALWLSRPDWRKIPLKLVAVDTAPRPMELGRALIKALAAALDEDLLWQIELVRMPFLRSLREVRGTPHLLMAGNVLNEWRDRGNSTREERLDSLAGSVSRLLGNTGTGLFIEPGTRLGGGLTAGLREAALSYGLLPLAPCTHTEPCPLLRRRDRGWCHAVQNAGGPGWLARLAAEARLPKDSLSLSFMLLRSEHYENMSAEGDTQGLKDHVKATEGASVARIISDAFFVPGLGHARYACCEKGLAILGNAADIPFGAEVLCRSTIKEKRDTKSGALIMEWLPK